MTAWRSPRIPALLTTVGLFALGSASLSAAPTPGTTPVIELGAPFSDSAILQRQMPLPVWGWSKPGTGVTVEFAGQKKTATAGNDGKWMLQLDAAARSLLSAG